MSAAPLLPSSADLPRRMRFTRADVDRLMAAGVFEGQRFELIDGELYDKTAQAPPHAFVIGLLLEALAKLFPPGAIRVQLPLEAGGVDRERSLPEPDIAVVVERKAEYPWRHPSGPETLLVVEVADSSVVMDLSRKVALYARAGVPEYWVVDLTRRMVVAHRRPDGATYRMAELFAPGDILTLEGRNEPIRVGEILPELE